jgi:hypothetical protein
MIFIIIFGIFTQNNIAFLTHAKSIIGKDAGSWQFNRHLAEKVLQDKDKDFGYYIYSADEYGYSPRYGINYLSRQQKNSTVYPYEKKPITYLIIGPYGKDMSRGSWWTKNKVHITKPPIKTKYFPNGFRIEKYILTPEEIAVPAESDLIKDIIFR